MYTEDAVSTGDEDASLDVFSQACADDPHPVYQEMHARCPVGRENGVFGPSSARRDRLSSMLYLGLLMIAFPVLVYVPTHLLLLELFP